MYEEDTCILFRFFSMIDYHKMIVDYYQILNVVPCLQVFPEFSADSDCRLSCFCDAEMPIRSSLEWLLFSAA